MRLKKMLMVCLFSAAFLSAGRIAFAGGVSGSDLLNYDISPETVQVVQEDSAEAEQIIQEDSAEAEQVIQEDSAEAEQIIQEDSAEAEQELQLSGIPSETKQSGESKTLLSEGDDDDKPGDNDTQEDSIIIVRQPEDRYYVPGSCITFLIKAQGDGLKYQWYYKKRGETSFSVWKNRTHSSESVAPNESWDGIELYCEITDAYGNTISSDTVMACIDDSKKVLAVGDSICRGSRNGYRGFVGDLGLPYLNAGVNGATLAVGANEITDIPTLLAEIADYSPEIIIAEGGVNDYVYNAPLGEIPSEPLVSATDLDEEALGTAMGGLQRLLLMMAEKYPDAERYFLITHKTTHRQGKIIDGNTVYTDNDNYLDWTVTQNSHGYTQQDLHDAIVQCCGVYGVEVIDVYNDSVLDTADLSFCSDVSYFVDNSVTEKNYVDIDGIHPLSLGYYEYYVPEILKHIDVTQPFKELSIVGQPVNTTVPLGDPVTLSLTANGSFLKYQWYFRKKGQSDFRVWTNRVLPTETVTPNVTWDGIQLYCVVTDRLGNFVQSDIITVTVDHELAIRQQPVDSTVCLGNPLTVSVKAKGIDLSYQWYFKKKGQTGFSAWPNRTLSSETVTPTESWDGMQLYCVVTDESGSSVNSETITISLIKPIKILGVGDSICAGARNGGKGFVGYLELPYKNIGVSGATLSTKNTAVKNIPDRFIEFYNFHSTSVDQKNDGWKPDIIIVDGGHNDYGYDAPLGDIPEQMAYDIAGTDDSTVMGSLQRLFLLMSEYYPDAQIYFLTTHKIYRNAPASPEKNGYLPERLNGQGYTEQDLHDALVACCNVYNVEVIDVFNDSAINSYADEYRGQYYYNRNFSFDPCYRPVSEAKDNTTDYFDKDGVHPLNRGYLEGYVPLIKEHINLYQPIDVPALAITQQPENQTVTLGDSLTFSIQAQGINLKYQWYYKKEGQASFTKYRSNAVETVTPLESWDGMQLYCVVTDGYGYSIQSDIITVTVEQELAITRQPVNSSVTLGEPLTLSVRAKGIGLRYQWYFKKEGQEYFREWTNRVLPTETVTPTESWDGIQLYCRVTDKRGNYIDSDIITVTVEQELAITRQPVNSSVTLGEPLTLSVMAQGIGLRYQWYFKKEGQSGFSVWKNHTSATETVTPNATWDGIQLYCRITDSFGNSVQSDVITVAVEQPLAILQQPVNSSVTLGDSLTLSLKAQGIGISYQWYYKKEGQTDFSPWKNRTHSSETVTPPESWNGIQLFCRVTDKRGSYIDSDIVTVTVEQELAITRQPVSTAVTLGDSLILSVEAQGIGLHYQWYYKKKGQKQYSIWKNHTSASESVTPNATWNGIQLYCKITDKYGNTVNSDTITVKLK